MPAGSAFDHTWTRSGIAVWRLHIRGVEVPRRLVLVDGELVELSRSGNMTTRAPARSFPHLGLPRTAA